MSCFSQLLSCPSANPLSSHNSLYNMTGPYYRLVVQASTVSDSNVFFYILDAKMRYRPLKKIKLKSEKGQKL